MEKIIVLIILLAIGVGLLTLLALFWQKKALNSQQKAISHIDISLGLQKKSVDMQEHGIALTQNLLDQNAKIISLLEEIKIALSKSA